MDIGKKTGPRKLYSLLYLLLLLALPVASTAAKLPVAGWVEAVHLLPAEVRLKAKLDTGAKTSSLHAEVLKIFKRDGERWVRFQINVVDTDGVARSMNLERPKVRGVRIKEHDGEHASRPVVKMKFCFNGRVHEEQFSLADRSEFIYPVLLGRRFLAGNAVVDAGHSFLLSAACPTEEAQP